MRVFINATFPIDNTKEGNDALADLGRQIVNKLDDSVVVETVILDGDAYIYINYRSEDNEATRTRAEDTRTWLEQMLNEEELDDVSVELVIIP